MVTISRFSDTFSLAGGLNLPKIIECIGSDGQYYKQLVKGKSPTPREYCTRQTVFSAFLCFSFTRASSSPGRFG
jgi:ataxia telangiectasia mutated family protein